VRSAWGGPRRRRDLGYKIGRMSRPSRPPGFRPWTLPADRDRGLRGRRYRRGFRRSRYLAPRGGRRRDRHRRHARAAQLVALPPTWSRSTRTACSARARSRRSSSEARVASVVRDAHGVGSSSMPRDSRRRGQRRPPVGRRVRKVRPGRRIDRSIVLNAGGDDRRRASWDGRRAKWLPAVGGRAGPSWRAMLEAASPWPAPSPNHRRGPAMLEPFDASLD